MNLLLIVAASVTLAKGQYLECPVPHGFTVIAQASDVPSVIAEKFNDGETAMLGERWQAGDEFSIDDKRKGIEFVLHKGTR